MLIKKFATVKLRILAMAVSFLVAQETRAQECLLVEDACKWPEGYVPDEVDINLCIDLKTQEGCFPYFDASQCTNQQCLLGYQTDQKGCVRSCDCKKSGLLGDIMVYSDDLEDYNVAFGLVPGVRAASIFARKWTDIRRGKNYIIPYKFSPTIEQMPKAMGVIRHALEQFHAHTCLKFQQWNGEEDHIFFYYGSKCSSHVGKTKYGGRQSVGQS